jgi:thioredoxin-related protein
MSDLTISKELIDLVNDNDDIHQLKYVLLHFAEKTKRYYELLEKEKIENDALQEIIRELDKK